MPKKVRKTFGEYPEVVAVLRTQVSFDENGHAIVEDEIADVLEQIPGYEVEAEEVDASEDHKYEIVQDDITSIGVPPSEDDTEDDADNEDEDEEDAEEVPVKPSKPARTRKSPSRK